MRRRRPERRKILPDPVFKDLSISKFINFLMKGGKKGVAEKIFYNALDIIKQKTKSDGIKIFEKAIENTSPSVEVKSRRIGGATYQVPIEVPKHRKFFLASHWLINSATSRSGKPMSERLAAEFISASNNEGGAIKKKEDTHRMAEANKAFAHFRN
ncbi:MAG: 30S ribosomal protein S7 [Candidatus Marinimicrobia bacterium]|nr:30S ribosomal protein S7 [Candidatus Neomarinimicrobiota bacterium]